MKENRIGCSGFVYPGWKGRFYPADLPRSRWLEYYSSKFNSLELNATFYRFPVVKNLKALHDGTPEDFKFTVKAHKLITHSMRMKNAKDKVKEFTGIVHAGMDKKLGCILFQLPPSFTYTQENLDNILGSVPPEPSSVIEFRNPSWWNRSVYDALSENGITFCNNDYPGMPEEIVPTKKRFYMRFHGKPVLYKSEYANESLKDVVQQIPKECNERYIYFNNTWFVAAVTNALAIREML